MIDASPYLQIFVLPPPKVTDLGLALQGAEHAERA
jgi:hypothetical protein